MGRLQKWIGDLNGEFWLGLDKIHRLTTASGGQQNYLQFDLGDHEGNKRYAKYSSFQVADSSTNYRLTVAGYSGDAMDSFSSHNGRMFTAKDHDHDTYGGNCANLYQGAWWYDRCQCSNLNGVYMCIHLLDLVTMVMVLSGPPGKAFVIP